jgi:type I restriction enzyme S subunit
MSVWPYKTISSLGTVVTGSTPRTTEARFYGGDIPFVTPAELDGVDPVFSTPRTLSEEGANEARVLPEGTVMVCCIGSLGKVGIAGRPVATNQQINSVVFDTTRVWPRFGYYACRLLKPKLETMAPATTLAIVSKSKFESLKIPLPPLAEQRRIAVILDQVEVLRAKRRRALAQLDTLTQSLFLDIFGDPATNPKGWPSRPLGQLTTKFSDGPFGSNLKSSHYTETGVRVIRLQNIGVGEFIDEDRAYIAPEHFAGLAKHECLPGDVLIGTLGDPNLRACVQPTW